MTTSGTTVTCPASLSWMNNHIGQNPCAVAGWLVELCTGQACAWSFYSGDRDARADANVGCSQLPFDDVS